MSKIQVPGLSNRNVHLSNTQSGDFQMKWIILQLLPKLAQNFNTQNEQEQSTHLKRTLFKYSKLKFSSQIDYSVIFTQLCLKHSLHPK